MESTLTNHDKNVATVLHVASFSKYFFPFGNFILPIIFWTMYKKDSSYIDHHGKEVINFQLSLLCYKIAATMLCIPFFIAVGIHNVSTWDIFWFHDISINVEEGIRIFGISLVGIISGLGALLFFAFNITYTIVAAMKANEGERYRYPLTYRFIK
ncbi:hypothetical protein KORDIASMS9_02659 [Kordia sp. SMS9]|uniref:DUF4870 domain-containing protein n=1 Tax=Kordia sp. SMS9 TaxID=2282170 RepID=UPI000E0CC9AD|nr:DUF4870 domain-containing protein [Kordia sp. SMS9]AXG70419.1 hypothetical protein KORDIASMS9_02659 [Kordia sp. SMS9]